MSDFAALSKTLVENLQLALPPVTVALVDERPEGVPAFDGSVPGGCRFWEEAASRAFVTATADHALCAIGVHTHNLAEPTPQSRAELVRVLQVMSDLTYVREQDVAQIPRLTREIRYVVYAPLAEAPVTPDVVLLFAHARQGLIIAEAAQQVEQAATPALGRPACAIVPQVVESGRAAVSLGCCGARAYLDHFSDDIALWALPGAGIDAYVERIAALAAANNTLAAFHRQRRLDVEAGQQPTIDESLARLG